MGRTSKGWLFAGEIRQRYLANESIGSLARNFSVTRPAIRKILTAGGVQLRSLDLEARSKSDSDLRAKYASQLCPDHPVGSLRGHQIARVGDVVHYRLGGRFGRAGFCAALDADDLTAIRPYFWSGWNGPNNKRAYAKAGVVAEGRPTTILMHRIILGTDLLVDHIDFNGLNNRQDNLRPADNPHSQAHTEMLRNNTSGYRGVYVKKNGTISAQIRVNRKLEDLGIFPTLEAAARAFDARAVAVRGKFAFTNFHQE